MSRPISCRWAGWLSSETDEYGQAKIMEAAPEDIKKEYEEYNNDYIRRYIEAQEKGEFMRK